MSQWKILQMNGQKLRILRAISWIFHIIMVFEWILSCWSDFSLVFFRDFWKICLFVQDMGLFIKHRFFYNESFFNEYYGLISKVEDFSVFPKRDIFTSFYPNYLDFPKMNEILHFIKVNFASKIRSNLVKSSIFEYYFKDFVAHYW